MGRQCKPAAEYDMRVARGLLQRASAHWPAYAIVTTPSAYAAAQEYLVREPAGVVFAEWLDSAHQQDLSDRLPAGIELVIGLGGGKALDASKFVALDKDAELILVPTILSSGAIIHSHVARWDGYQTVGDLDDWPWVDCQYVLVDVDVVSRHRITCTPPGWVTSSAVMPGWKSGGGGQRWGKGQRSIRRWRHSRWPITSRSPALLPQRSMPTDG